MQYDSKIIQEFAARLYQKANSVIAIYTILGLVIGLAVGAMVGKGAGAMVGAAILGIIGFMIGTDRAFQYKLQAQTALCQVEIEKNTKSLNVQNKFIHEPSALPLQTNSAEFAPAVDGQTSTPASSTVPQKPDTGPLGKCPSCNAEIPLNSLECPIRRCRALFGSNSAWKVEPL